MKWTFFCGPVRFQRRFRFLKLREEFDLIEKYEEGCGCLLQTAVRFWSRDRRSKLRLAHFQSREVESLSKFFGARKVNLQGI